MIEDIRHAILPRLEAVREAMLRASRDHGRDPGETTLVAVSKRQPVDAIMAAFDLGVTHFGENQIQEGVEKVRRAPSGITWHLIGHLQSNKVRPAVKHFPWIHSVDSAKLLRRIDRIAAEEHVKPRLLLQVNHAEDPAKFGMSADQAEAVLKEAMNLSHVSCVGLMAIPPLGFDACQIKSFFGELRDLAGDFRRKYPPFEGKLSMGMTSDFESAIACGSHFVRVGTAIFGERMAATNT